ncbi:response regulator [Antarcticirhabdus aurantiaca]|uniref:Response regulator n=1 Tax=Antarcticirhabdus aurantiaca TaxID=2606717 RepID=A0ACD4NRE2_9HYPH|nr:response regulator [Antarcticirhabdus aurantiaca]WAJ29475.1 response regulator [Jeongeuplla avenae]
MVLVVDDEPLVRMYAADMFEDLGVEVLEARDGVEALEILERRPDVSLLFSDCRMPRMTGPELAEEASKRWPSLRIVLASGYTDVRPTRWPLIAKPYDAAILAGIAQGQPPCHATMMAAAPRG